MIHRIAAVLLLAGLGAFAAPCHAAEAPVLTEWKHIPADALLVLRISSIDGFSAGFHQLMTAMDRPDEAAVAELRRGLLEIAQTRNRPAAVDARAAIYAILTPAERNADAFLVRTKDDDQLRRGVLRADDDTQLVVEKPANEDGFTKVTNPDSDVTWYFARRGEWTLYTRYEEAVKYFSAENSKSLAASISDNAAQLLASDGGSVYVNLASIRNRYADEIDTFKNEILTAIDAAREELRQQGLGADGLQELAKVGFVALSDVEWFAGNVQLGNEGGTARGEVRVTSNSPTAKFLAGNKPASLEQMGLLTKGRLAYFGAHFGDSLAKAWVNIAPKLAANEDTEARQVLAESIELYGKAGLTSAVGGFSFPEDAKSGILQDLIYECQDASVMRKAMRLYAEGNHEVKTPLFTQRFSYKPDAETFQDRPVDLIIQAVEFGETNDTGAMFARAFLKRIFGGDKLVSRMTLVENLAILATGNDPKYLRQLVGGMESGEGVAGLEKAYTDTRDRLDEDANLLIMIDAPQLVVDLFRNLRQIPELAPILAALPFNLGVDPGDSYAGLSISTAPTGLRGKVFVPVAQPQGILSIFGQ